MPIPVGVSASSRKGGATYGYSLGGNTSGRVVTSDRLTFSNSTTAAQTTANLSQARDLSVGISDISLYGYVLGGNSGAFVVTADRLTFSNSTAEAQTTANLPVAKERVGGLSDGLTYGYIFGGFTGASVAVNTTDRLTFSTSSTAARTAANLTGVRWGSCGISDRATYGYSLGGNTSIGGAANVTITDRITFSTSDTAARTAADLSQARNFLCGISDNLTYGYALGGFTGANVRVVTADRLTFSTSATAAHTTANLSTAVNSPTNGGVSDGSLYGYVLGGSTGASVVTAQRMTFSTSVIAAQTTANLSTARSGSAGISDGAV